MELKINKRIRKVLATGLALFSLLFCVSTGSVVFAEDAKLPVVQKWVNGAALSSDGVFLRDTWAVDESGLTDSKYVLISQDSTEVFRVKNYPDDVSAGATVTTPTYSVPIKLSVPESLTGELILTLENDAAAYTVSFTESNRYEGSCILFPGQYRVTDIEATSDGTAVYEIKGQPVLKVDNEAVSTSWELLRVGTPAENTAQKTPPSDDDGVDVLGVVQGFDTNGDLIKDTVSLVISLIVLFGVYGVIKYRRKKKEELNNH